MRSALLAVHTIGSLKSEELHGWTCREWSPWSTHLLPEAGRHIIGHIVCYRFGPDIRYMLGSDYSTCTIVPSCAHPHRHESGTCEHQVILKPNTGWILDVANMHTSDMSYVSSEFRITSRFTRHDRRRAARRHQFSIHNAGRARRLHCTIV